MADGFLGRWSRRKLDVKQGRPLEPEPPAPAARATAAAAAVPAASATPKALADLQARAEPAPGAMPAADPAAAKAPPPTLEDARDLTPDSDFRRFVAADTPAEVKNAAMKKLFADPHFNVMDGMDVYIDDYSQPDPMPQAMLRSLASAEFLGLFREEKRKDEVASGASPAGDAALAQSMAQSGPSGASQDAPPATPAPEATDADPDLRLQQDHAPGPQGPGHGTR